MKAIPNPAQQTWRNLQHEKRAQEHITWAYGSKEEEGQQLAALATQYAASATYSTEHVKNISNIAVQILPLLDGITPSDIAWVLNIVRLSIQHHGVVGTLAIKEIDETAIDVSQPLASVL